MVAGADLRLALGLRPLPWSAFKESPFGYLGLIRNAREVISASACTLTTRLMTEPGRVYFPRSLARSITIIMRLVTTRLSPSRDTPRRLPRPHRPCASPARRALLRHSAGRDALALHGASSRAPVACRAWSSQCALATEAAVRYLIRAAQIALHGLRQTILTSCIAASLDCCGVLVRLDHNDPRIRQSPALGEALNGADAERQPTKTIVLSA